MIADKIHGLPVLAWAEVEVQSDGSHCGIVLVKVKKDEWVTAWYRQGQNEWSNGHYFVALRAAQQDFLERTAQNGFGKGNGNAA